MNIKTISLFPLLCIIICIHSNAMDISPDNTSYIVLSLEKQHKEAIHNWCLAHQKYRNQWAVLRQTPLYNEYKKFAYASSEKSPTKRAEIKAKRNETPEGIKYLEAKRDALILLKEVPGYTHQGHTYKIVSTGQNKYEPYLINILKHYDFYHAPLKRRPRMPTPKNSSEEDECVIS